MLVVEAEALAPKTPLLMAAKLELAMSAAKAVLSGLWNTLNIQQPLLLVIANIELCNSLSVILTPLERRTGPKVFPRSELVHMLALDNPSVTNEPFVRFPA